MQVSLQAIKSDFEKLEDYFKLREPKNYKEQLKIIKLFFPKMEDQCRNLLEACADHTIDNGYQDESDYVKDRTWAILGVLIGDKEGL